MICTLTAAVWLFFPRISAKPPLTFHDTVKHMPSSITLPRCKPGSIGIGFVQSLSIATLTKVTLFLTAIINFNKPFHRILEFSKLLVFNPCTVSLICIQNPYPTTIDNHLFPFPALSISLERQNSLLHDKFSSKLQVILAGHTACKLAKHCHRFDRNLFSNWPNLNLSTLKGQYQCCFSV